MSANRRVSYATLQQQRLFLIALVLGLLAVIFGVFLQIYQEQQVSQVDPTLRQMAVPLTPTLDVTSLDRVRGYELLTLEQIKSALSSAPLIQVQPNEAIGEEIEAQLEENTLSEEEQLSDEELASFDQPEFPEEESLDELTEEELTQETQAEDELQEETVDELTDEEL